MAAPIPSALAFKTAGVDSLQSNLANWVLASNGTTPALRVPVATDTVSYLTAPSDSLSGFNLIDILHAVTISGTGTVLIGVGGSDSVTLVAGGSSSLFLAGTTGGQDLSLVGTSTTARLLVTGPGYSEEGDGSGNIQNCDFSGNLDVETEGAVYSNIKVGGNFSNTNGDIIITGMEVLGTSFADNANSDGLSSFTGIFHGVAITTFQAWVVGNTPAFSGTFLGGQGLSNVGGYSSTLYDQQYVESQVTVNHQIFPLPLGY